MFIINLHKHYYYYQKNEDTENKLRYIESYKKIKNYLR